MLRMGGDDTKSRTDVTSIPPATTTTNSSSKSSKYNDAELESCLRALGNEIRAIDARIASLVQFLDHITSLGECFTENEVTSTRQKLQDERTLRAAKARVLEEKVELYESHVVVLQSQLEARKRVIDVATGPLEHSPDLMNVFAQQHAVMTQDLEKTRAYLLSKANEETAKALCKSG